MPKVRLQRARIGALVRQDKAGRCRSMCGCTLKPILAALPARSISFCSRSTVNGAPRSETKMKGDLASRFRARSARSSSPSRDA